MRSLRGFVLKIAETSDRRDFFQEIGKIQVRRSIVSRIAAKDEE